MPDQTDQSAATEVLQSEMEALETDRYQVARLKNNRAWLSLRGHLLKKREQQRQEVLKMVLGPQAKKEPVDQRKVDYARSMIETIDWILGLPEKMEKEAGSAD